MFGGVCMHVCGVYVHMCVGVYDVFRVSSMYIGVWGCMNVC